MAFCHLFMTTLRTWPYRQMKSFFSVRYNPYHVLHQLLPPAKNPNYSLRERSHNLTVSNDISVVKRNFIYRMLFTDIY